MIDKNCACENLEKKNKTNEMNLGRYGNERWNWQTGTKLWEGELVTSHKIEQINFRPAVLNFLQQEKNLFR